MTARTISGGLPRTAKCRARPEIGRSCSGLRDLRRREHHQQGVVIGDVGETVLGAAVDGDDTAWPDRVVLAFHPQDGAATVHDVDLVRLVRMLVILATGGQPLDPREKPGRRISPR